MNRGLPRRLTGVAWQKNQSMRCTLVEFPVGKCLTIRKLAALERVLGEEISSNNGVSQDGTGCFAGVHFQALSPDNDDIKSCSVFLVPETYFLSERESNRSAWIAKLLYGLG